ncbi:MAG: hypothetical protein OJF47_003067 [Nitrospira sp.]|jgi:hypothetical protein|nr:MAG: hypothetical protein OJF47_003067 [Nitrospira sp.]
MTGTTLNAVIALGFPIAVLLGGGPVLNRISGRASTIKRLTQAGHTVPKPLNMRWLGYGPAAVRIYWRALQKPGRLTERTFLRLDLLFPFLYGGALSASLWWVWVTLNNPFPLVWLTAPLAIALAADWTENLVQLNQLGRFQDGSEGDGNLQGAWIRVSSCATIIKLWLMSSLYVALGLLVWDILTTGER